MTSDHTFVRIIRLSWPVLGGTWGAWLGFGGYLRLPHNGDSFAMLFALGYFILFACVGLAIGSVLGAAVGGVVERFLRQIGVPIAGALCVATAVTVLVLWQVAAMVQTTFPGLKSERIQSTFLAAKVEKRGHAELASL